MTTHDMREQCAQLHEDEAIRLEASKEEFAATPGLFDFLVGWHRSWADKLRALPVAAPQPPAKPEVGAEPEAAGQVSETKGEREKWLASLFPEDRMFDEIFQIAKDSYQRHITRPRGQQVTRADGIDAHIVWATKKWIEKNEPRSNTPDAQAIRDATVEEAAKVCDEQAERNEAACEDETDATEVPSLRSAAWQMKVCAQRIRALKGGAA